VGNSIGEMNVKKAKAYAKYIMLLGISFELFVLFNLNVFKKEVAMIFTDEDVVIQHISNSLFWQSLSLFFDAFVTIEIGIIKGIGKQAQATVAYAICFYLVSLPCTYMLCFICKYSLSGLWGGVSTGLSLLVIYITRLLIGSDWHKIAKDV
jgi:MATE family multidrug resistance protein